jgi:carnitine O-palmitoyltransferase 1
LTNKFVAPTLNCRLQINLMNGDGLMHAILDYPKSFIKDCACELKERASEQLDRAIVYIFQGFHKSRILNKEALVLDASRVKGEKLLRQKGWPDRELPSFPVSSLKTTVDRFLLSVAPILSEEELEELCRQGKSFVENEGVKLQRDLLLYGFTQKNWVSTFWEPVAYLMERSPLPFSSNYYGLGPIEEPSLLEGLPQGIELRHLRAALAIHTALELIKESRAQVLDDLFGAKSEMIAMDQYFKLFGTTRLPGKSSDRIYSSFSNHFLIFVNGQYVKIEFDPKEEIPLAWIVNTIHHLELLRFSSSQGVETLTSLNRDQWFELRNHLISIGNQDTLHQIESAQFAIVLDPASPATLDDMGYKSQFTSQGRWYDLGVELFIYRNGKIAGNLEHTPKDAVISANLIERIAKTEQQNKTKFGGYLGYEHQEGQLRFTPLEFKIDSELAANIKQAEQVFRTNADKYDLNVNVFESFGKNRIKNLRLSPDSFIQMALQLAYYRLHERSVALTYETASLRGYAYGRTETIRSQSIHSKSFCNAMQDHEMSSAIKKELLIRAILDHNQTKLLAMSGQGIDRHLLGLRVLAHKKKVSSPFLESKAVRMGFTMATSQTPIPSCYGGGFLPLEEKGYGISYNAAFEDKLVFMVSSTKFHAQDQAHRFTREVFQALQDMIALFP